MGKQLGIRRKYQRDWEEQGGERMSNGLKIKPKIRRKCRKCGAKLVNKPEYGAVCPECGWYRISYTDNEDIIRMRG